MCERADYMPSFNPDMVYVLLTKNHFTFAHMLIRDGGRTLRDYKMGTCMRDIKLLPGDREGQMIQEHGVLASIFDEGLFREPSSDEELNKSQARSQTKRKKSKAS